ncbi:Tat pathway signal sequence domain protein [Streptomyces roseirectus]|uniref:Tat pathway signal sequence domain protein n=1 Tax=Streptomyces roseirectus TaxID=2768066 RepID=A0A7H0IKG9_9ACTN|nr:Tat pathway signal sequence domain protein [Streptomyces roseirectus]QNP73285.1 Tat pathway signal sequence domain protein [Streptomyces roseirectus]
MNRRRILLAATALALTPAGRASAAVPATPRLDLTATTGPWLREITLSETRVPQSFAFDNTNKRLYTAQLTQGGRILAGESAAVSGADRSRNGDLCVTRLDWRGTVTGRMYLKGFGHGVSIGAEPVGTSTYLWTETDAVPDSQGNGYGTRVARFRFTDGAVLTTGSTSLVRHDPVPGSDHNTVALDPVHSRIAHRRRADGVWTYALYDLVTFKAGVFEPLATLTQPDVLTGPTFQGYATLGRHLYTLDGTALSDNVHLTAVDWNTGAVLERQLTDAGGELFYREPEGMAIQIPDATSPARLHFGLASEESLTQTDKKASFYYTDTTVR